MAIGPINYSAQVVNPIDSFMQGISQVQQVQSNDQLMQARQQQMDAQKQQMEARPTREEAQAMWSDVGQVLRNPNATAEDLAGLVAQYPMIAEEISGSWGTLSEARQQAGGRYMAQLYTMLENGNVPIAMEMVDERIAAAERSNDQRSLAEAKMTKRLLQADPTAAKNLVNMLGMTTVPDLWKNISGGGSVQSSNVLPDGTSIMVMRDGNVVVRDSANNVLSGQDAQQAIAEANQLGIDLAGGKASATTRGRNIAETETGAAAAAAGKAGTTAQELSIGAFDAAAKARSTVSNIDAAIDALDRGANTGVIESQFPNWNAATIELENAANRLGLDVIGSVTFGALSEGELRLAMSTALPLNLDEPELKAWLQRKRSAQVKLIDYMEEQARFLAKPGNTLADWLENVQGRTSPQGDAEQGSGKRSKSGSAWREWMNKGGDNGS